MKTKNSLFSSLALIALNVSVLSAHKADMVHPFTITANAEELLRTNPNYSELNNYFYRPTEIPPGYNELTNYNKSEILKQGTLGTIEEDNAFSFKIGEVSNFSWLNHFYNPVTGKGGAGIGTGLSDNSIIYGKDIWNAAIWNYYYGDKGNAYYKLGRVIHLLEDLSSVPHVYNDAHVFETEGYEDWVGAAAAQGTLVSGQNPRQPLGAAYGDSGLNYDDFLHEMAQKTFHSAKIKGKIFRDTLHPVEGDLGNMFPNNESLAYLEYIDDSIFDWNGHWEIANLGAYENFWVSDSWWLIKELPNEENTTGVAYVDGYFYIEKPKSIVPKMCWDANSNAWVDNSYTLAQLWAGAGRFRATPNQTDQLIPLVIEYTAGLMKFFYDEKEVIKNRIVHPLAGTITDQNFTPLPGAEVSVDGVVSASVITDADGKFTLSLLDGTYNMVVSHPGHEAIQRTVVVPVPAQGEIFSSLSRLGMFTGTLTRTDGTTPVPNAHVELLVNGSLNNSAITDVSGVYSVSVPAGIYTLRFSAEGFEVSEVANRSIALGETVTISPRMKKLNPANAPLIEPTTVTSPQTNNHAIEISARVTDLTSDGLAGLVRSVKLFYQGVSGVSYQEIAMEDPDGDNIYVANIPPQSPSQPAGQSVKYYFWAEDTEGNNITKPYPYQDPQLNPYRLGIIMDNASPEVVRSEPLKNEKDVGLARRSITAYFNEAIKPQTVNGTSFLVKYYKDSVEKTLRGLTSYDEAAKGAVYTLSSDEKLLPNTVYTCVLSGVQDLSGNSLASYTWSFTTAQVLPCSITRISRQPQHLNLTTTAMSFAFDVSRPIKELKIIFVDPAATEETEGVTKFTIIKPIPDSSVDITGANVAFHWDGKYNGENIPAKEYAYRIEVLDSEYGLTGSSEFQPVESTIKTEVVLERTRIESSYTGGGDHFWIGFPQTIYIDVDYALDFGGSRVKVSYGANTFKIGTSDDSILGRTVHYNLDIPYATQIKIEGPDTGFMDIYCPDKFKVTFKERISNIYPNKYQSSGYQINNDSFHTASTLSRNQQVKLPFKIQPSPYYDYQVVAVNIAAPPSGDYDNNPEVQSRVFGNIYGYDSIDGEITLANQSPPLPSFLIDKQKPTVRVSLDSVYFSQTVVQDYQIAATITDNLTFSLPEISLQILNQAGALVKTLYTVVDEAQGTKNIVWDGKGSNEYNGGQVVSDGIYVVKLSAKDKAGNSSETSALVTVDNTLPLISAPSITIAPATHPSQDVFTSNDTEISVKYTGSDNLSDTLHTVLTYTSAAGVLAAKDESDISVSPSAKNFAVSFDGKDAKGDFLADGVYDVVLTVIDKAGNKREVLFPKLKIDRSAPLANVKYVDYTIFTPDDGVSGTGDGYKDRVTLNYELSAPALVEINIQDSLGRILSSSSDGTLKTAGTYPWNGKIGSNFVADGSYVLKIKISDEFGNQTVTNTPVIKNTIPAQLKFPAASGSAVGGVVTVKGVASDPGINNTAEFTGYQVWYREGGNIDYSQIQNNPANPDPAIWKSLPVPPGNQSQADLAYPNATHSARSVVNGVLAAWDTTALQTGAIYTVLLAATDSAGVLSFDSREVIIDQALDNNKPVVAITAPSNTNPPLQFNMVSDASRLNISYSLVQQADKKADIAVEIFKILDPITKKLGNIVFRKDLFGQASGDAISWSGRDYSEKYVETGDYRVRVTARDSDNIGLSMAEADIKVNAFVTEPFKIEKFETSDSVLAPGGQTTLKYTVSKEAFVTIKVFDSDNNLVQVLTEAVRVPAKTERQVIFNPAQVGLFSIQLEVVSADNPDVKENAAISIAVTAGGTANLAEIVYPQENAVLQGNSNFNWVASGQGEYYPPQTFTSKIRASGKEVITTISPNAATDTLTGDFELGAIKNTVSTSNNELKLAPGENQSQNVDNIFAPHSSCQTRWSAQGFYSISNGTIKHLELKYYPQCRDGGMDATIELREDASGLPGNVVAEVGLGSLNCRAPGFYGGDFNYDITGQTRYWVTMKEIVWGSGTGGGPLGSDYDSYGRGEALFKSACGSRWYRGTEAPAFRNIRDFSFAVQMAPFAKSGTFTSRTFDTGLGLDHFGNFEVLHQKNGQTVSYKAQSSNSPDETSFDPPLTVLPGEQIPSTKKRYIRWLAELSTQDQNYSPVIQEAKLNYSNIQTQTVDFAVDKSLSGPAFVTFYNHPTLIPETPGDLRSLIPELAPKDVVDGPYYNILEAANSYVLQSITTENGGAQLKAVTSVKEPWSTGDDQSLAGGKFGKADAVFNNETNPESFSVEAPYDFSAKTLRSIVFSSGYPAPDMTKNASIKNKYLFWKDGSGNIVDNPYTSVPPGGFGVDFMYLDNTGNTDLALNKLQEKASNSNTDPQGTSINIDDEFSVRMAAGAAPRVFVELRGNTSSASQGFKSYSLAYKRASELVYRAITVKNSNSPVSANGTLGFWDVTGLNGEYNVKLIVLDANGIRESERKVNIGKVVPGQTPAISPPVFVNAPWNKAFLEFPDDCLLEQAVVSITPVKPVSLNIALNSSIPQPIGAVYDLQPSGIKFKDPANNPAYLTVRFTSEEMAGIDPAHLTIYEISSEGVLEPLDARVTYDQNGNGQLDAGEIVTVRSPVRHFSYFMIVPEVPLPQLDALPGITNSESVLISGRAEANSSVEIFLNGVLAQTLKTDSSGKIENAGLQLAEGKNTITARAIRRLNENIRKYSAWTAQVIVEKDSTLGQIENVTFPRTFKPQLGESGTLTYSLAKEMVINLSIKKENNEVVKSLLNATSQVPGKYSIGWNGIGSDGVLAAGGKYIFDLRGVDAAGNEIKANFGPFELIKDTVPPLTSIMVGQPKYSGEYLYISTASLLSFVRVDNQGEIGGASGLGVGGTKISLAPPVYIDYLLPFSLTDGRAYSVSYFSFDVAGNTESVKNSTFVLDPDPPVTSMQINGAQYINNSTNILYLTDTSKIDFLSEDVQIGSLPGSGVKSIEYSLNPLAPVFNTYSSTFSLPTGEYLIAFNSTDKVLNRENIHISSLVVDGMEPLINVGFDSEVRRLPNGVLHISRSNAVMEIRITDQPSFGSGIKATSLEINGVSENIEPELSKPLGLGRNYVAIKTEDNLGNKAEKIFEVVVGDLLPPTDLKPADGFITNKSSVTFSWTAPTTTYYSLTEYDLHFSKQKNFVNSEFEQFVSSHVKVTVLITETGMVVQGLQLHQGAYRLITDLIPDHTEGTLEGVAVTPFIELPTNTTGISGFTVTQSLNGGEITHEYNFKVYQNYQYNPQPGPYSQITAGGGMTYDFPMGGAISFRSKLKRAALTDESPVLVKIEFTVNYLVAVPYYYCYKPCYYCGYYCYQTYYYDPRSYQLNVSATSGSLDGLRANGGAVELITNDIINQSTGPLAGTWLSPVHNVPEQAFKMGSFTPDFDSNGGEISFEFSQNSGPFVPISGIPLISFSPGDTIQFKASFSRNTPNDISPVLRGIALDFIAPPPTEKEISIPTIGRYYWKIRSKDGFGRYSDFSEESSFMYDNSAPEIIITSPTVNAKYLAGKSNLMLGFSALDGLDPSPRTNALLKQIADLGRPRADKPDYLIVSSMDVVNLTELDDGMWELLVEARDWAGNISTKSSGAFEIAIDTLSPVSDALVSGVKGQNDWYISTVTAVLTSTDNLTGVENIFYNLECMTSNGQTVSLSSGIYSGPLIASEEGLYTGYYYARDKFGNIESEKNISFKVDFDLPLVVAVGTPISNVYAWNKTPVTAMFKGADTASGIAYCVPNKVLLTEGSSQTVSGYCSDYAGLSSTRTLAVNIDTTAPSVLYTGIPPANEYGWNAGTVTVKFTCTDTTSGIRSCPADIIIGGEGVNISTSAEVFDYAENSTAVSVSSISIDKTIPLSSAALAGTYKNGWYTSPVSMTLSSTDSLSGIKESLYSLNGAAFSPYHPPVTISVDGGYAVKYYSKDKAGNAEPEKTLAFSIDRTAPQIGYTLSPQPNSYGWNNSSVLAVFNGTDTLSGMDICISSRTSAEGAGKTLSGWCRDIAGNISYSTAVVKIDISSPVVSVIANPAANSNNWNNTPVTVIFTGIDTISGNFSCSADRTASSEGAGQIVAGSCADYAGNSQAAFRAVSIDLTKPVTTAGFAGALVNGWYNAAVSITLVSSDTLSGVNQINYRLERAGVLVSSGVYAAPVNVSADGQYSVYYYGTDKAGNAEVEKSTAFKIDRTQPQVSYTLIPAANGNAWNKTAVQVIFNGTDTLSGVVSCSSKTISVEGQSQAAVGWCSDTAGNIAYSTAIVNVDLTIPAVSVTQAPAKNSYGWNNTSVTATFAGTDALSIISYCEPAKMMSNEGSSQTVSGYCRDYAGLSSTVTLTLSIDKTAPQISATRAPLANPYGWANQDISVNYTCSDGLSGVRTCPAPMLFNSEGLNISTSAIVYDYAGNTSQATMNGVSIDKTIPNTIAALPGGLVNGWYNTGISIPLTSTDTLSGVLLINYRLLRDGVLVSSGIYTVPVAASADGQYSLYYSARDKADNIEAEKITVFKIDRSRPAINISSPVAGQMFIATRGNIPVVYDVSDNFDTAPAVAAFLVQTEDRGSPRGVRPAKIAVSKGQSVEPLSIDDGIWRLTVSATDFADNAAYLAGGTFEVIHDVLPPRTVQTMSGGPLFAAGGMAYIRKETELKLTSADDLVASGDGAGLGVKGQVVDIKTGGVVVKEISFNNPMPAQNAVFVSTFSLAGQADGLYYLHYKAVDVLENTENTRISTAALDNTSPATTLAVSGGMQYAGQGVGSFYASSVSRFGLIAADPVTGNIASGVKLTSWRDSNGAVANTITGLAFNEGRHELAYWSTDNVENVEVVRSTTILVDNTAPVSEQHIGSPYYAFGGVNYITPTTPISFTAADPVAGTVASGVSRIEVSIDGAVFSAYTSALTFTEGRHSIKYRSVDNVGNTEAEKTLEVRSDNTSPVSGFNASGQYFEASGHKFAPLSFTYLFSSTDPVVNNVASGVKFSEYRIDGGVFGAYTSAFSLVEGIRLVEYRSHDNVSNAELIKAATVYVDDAVPQSSLAISQPKYEVSGGIYISTWTLFTLSSVDPVVNGVAAGVKDIRRRFGAEAYRVYSNGFIAPSSDGNKMLEYYGTDNVGNTEAAKSQAVKLDATAPMTALNITGGIQYAGPAAGSFYASAASRFGLSAADPVIGGVASGVKLTAWRDNNGTVANTISGLAFSEGRHELAYWSMDNVDNVEIIRSTTILVDNTAPVTEHHIGSQYYAVGGVNYITPATPLSFTAEDPVANAVAAGLARIETAVDGGQWQVYVQPLTFAEGRHTIKYRSVDNVGNTETEKTLEVRSDNTPPASGFSASGQYFEAAGHKFAPLSFTYSLTSADPVVNNVASGVKFSEYRIDGGALGTYTSAFSLAEGIRLVEYRSHDNVANVELVKAATVYVDNTVSQSSLAISQPRHEAADSIYVSTWTLFTLSAVDPVVHGVAAGVKDIRRRFGADAFGVYSNGFIAPSSDGNKVLEYYGTDNVGNTEAAKSQAVKLDATAPMTALSKTGGMQFVGTAAGSFYASLASRFGLPAVDPIIGGVASGVKQTSWRDNNGAVANTISSLAFGEGRHELAYWTMDNVENVEVVRSTTILVDNTAPVSEHHIGSPYYTAGGLNYITPATPLSFTAADPVVGTVASGVSRIEVSVDGAAFGVYSSALTFAEGRHVIKYRGIDNVGNTEAEHTLSVQSDATAPVSDFISSGQYYIASGRKYAPLSFTYALTATDPVTSNVASGVKFSEYRIDAVAFNTYSTAFDLSEGIRTVEYRSQDNVLNLEQVKLATIHVDATDPVTALAVTGGMQFAGPAAGSFYASLASRFGLVAIDPLINSVASGVKLTSWRDNNGAVANIISGLAFSEGRHELTYWSTDNVDNVEVVRSTTILVDNTAPVTEHHIGSPYYAVGGVNYITPATSLSFTAADPVMSEVSARVARIETAVDGGQWQAYTQPLKLVEGRHTISYRAIDNVGNTEAGKTLSVQSDATAPVSAWLVNAGEHIELGGKFYLNSLGKLALESNDPVVGNVASGVEGIYYGIDSTPSAKYTAAFGLAEGIRTLNFNAKDNVANAEVVKSTLIYVDGTKPVSELSISGDQYHGDKVYVSLRSNVVLTAADPIVSEVASSLRETRYSVDGGAFADYSTFKLAAEGKRLVSFYSVDQVGNVEATKTSELWVDATAPNTPLSIAGARHDADDLIYITRDSGIVLSPGDPITSETASGVMLTKYRIDGGLWQVYSGSFTITVEGRHTLEYYSLDRVQNAEILKTAALAVDNTPPATAITLGEPKYEAFGLPVLRPETPITLAAADIMAGEVVSGLKSIFYEAVNLAGGGSVVHSYVEPFTLLQGTYDVRFWSVDNVGNTESYKQKRLAVSTYQDDSLQAVDGLDLSGTADIAGAVKSNGVVSVSGNARILGDVTASTITLTGSNAQVTGQILNGQTPLSPEPIYLPAIAEGSGSAIPEEYLAAGELTLNSQAELTLTTGTYYVKGIKLSGGSNIRVAGKVELLVSGEISISGGSSFNAAGAASGLTIFVNTASSISFTGGGNLVARVYAPYSHLKLAGNALLGGHFFAKRATVSGTGNIIKAGETLPQTTSESGGGGGKKKASALAVGGGSYDVLAGPDPAFRLGEVYVFPNPAKGSEAPVFHIETGLAENVKISIYTISGRVAHEHTLAGLPVELDDGNGLSYAYEYVWRGHIPSGVYLYYIEARKAGQTLKKTGKFSVVR